LARALSVVGTAKAKLVAEKPLVVHVDSPAPPVAADAILTATALLSARGPR
jgi:hypothetical protein